MIKFFLLSFVLISFQNGFSQIKESPVQLYQRTVDFTRDKVWEVDALALIIDENETYINIKQIVDPITKKKIKGGSLSWALEYNGQKYLNLGYSDDLNNWNTFIKFDIVGKYSVIIIDDENPNNITNGGNYGVGLQGVLVKEITKWGKNWDTENDGKKKILFVDTTNYNLSKNGWRNAYCSDANFLTRKQLAKIMKDKFPDIDAKDVTFEKAIEIIHSLNE